MQPRILFTMLFLAAPAFAADEGISKEQWKTDFGRLLPSVLCEDASYFRHCLKLGAAQCEKAVLSATRVCLTDLDKKLPSVITTVQQAEDVGGLIGGCAGNSVEMRFFKQKSNEQKCQNPDSWMR